jgi:hypothetical protein
MNEMRCTMDKKLRTLLVHASIIPARLPKSDKLGMIGFHTSCISSVSLKTICWRNIASRKVLQEHLKIR